MAEPNKAQRDYGHQNRRIRAWRCPHCISEYAKDKIYRLCMFDSRDKSYIGDHWACGSVRLLRFIMIRHGVRLIPEERESTSTIRWMSINDGDKLIVTWRRGKQRVQSAVVVTADMQVRPFTWADFCQLEKDVGMDEADDKIDAVAWARNYKVGEGG